MKKFSIIAFSILSILMLSYIESPMSWIGIFVLGFVLLLANAGNKHNQNLVATKNTIVRTKMVSAGRELITKTSNSSAIGRGAIGGAVFGPVGAAVGAVTAKTKTSEKDSGYRTFLVEYSDGTKREKTVLVNSVEHDLYMEKLQV